MKRTTAILLSLILLLSCFPIAASAANEDKAPTAAGVEAKFRLLLEDLELVGNIHQSDRYFYEELGQYPAKNPEWVLIRGGLYDLSAKNNIKYQYAAFGNKLIRGNINSTPFKLGYGVYDVKSGAFYDLIDAWNMNLNNLRDVWDELAITDPYSARDNKSEANMYVIGDADADGEVTIVDATRIQRCLADLDVNPWEGFAETGADFIRGTEIGGATDYDRDGDTTIMDATRIQRNLAELPNILDYKLAWDERLNDRPDEEFDKELLITDRSQLDSKKRDQKMILDAYDDAFFKDHCLAALNIGLTSGTYRLTLKKVSIDKDGVLNVDFSRNNPPAITSDYNHRFIVIELPNTFADDIKDIRVNITPVDPTPIEPYSGPIDAKIVSEIKSQADEETAGALLINRRELEEFAVNYIDKIQIPAAYDNDYFKTHALVGAFFVLGGNYPITLKSAVLDKNGTLTVDFTYGSANPVSTVLSPRFVLVEISNAYNADIRSVKVNTELVEHYTGPIDAKIAYQTDRIHLLSDNKEFSTMYIKDRAALESFAVDFIEISDIPEKFNDDYFRTHALAGAFFHLGENYQLSMKNAEIGAGGILTVNFTCTCDQPKDHVMNMSPCFVLVEIPNTYNNDIQKVVVNAQYVESEDPNKPLANVVWYSEPEASRPSASEAEAQGYRMIDSQRCFHYSFEETYGSSPAFYEMIAGSKYFDDFGKNGILAIVKTPAQFKYLFPNKDASGYDDAFFKKTALVVLMHQGVNYDDEIDLSHLAVKGDTLYGQMVYLNNPNSSPMGNIYYDVHKVKLSDVKGVKRCALWDDPMYSHKYLLTPDEYYSGIPQKDEPTGSGYQKIDAEVVKQDDLEVNRENFAYYTWGGVFFNPDQFLFFNNEEYAPSGGSSAFDDYAYLAFYYRDKTNTAKVSGVYQNADKLEVYITETAASGTSSDKDRLSIRILRIRKSDLKNIRSIRLYSAKPSEPAASALYAEIPASSEIPEMPESPASQGYKTLSKITVDNISAPKWYDFEWGENTPLKETSTGYVLLIRSRAEMDYYLPDFDKEGKYNDNYFKNYALVAMLGQGYEHNDTAKLENLAVKGDTLYANAWVESHNRVIDGVPIEEPTAPVVWTFRQVSQSDVAAVKKISFWKKAPVKALSAAITPYDGRKTTAEVLKNAPATWIRTEELQTISGSDHAISANYGFDACQLAENDNGYMLLMKNRAEFRKHFAAMDQTGKYDDEFFKNNAIIAVYGQGRNTGYEAQLTEIAVVGNTELYADARIWQPHPEVPVGETEPMVWTFRKVSQSDVKDVESLGFWKQDNITAKITPLSDRINFEDYDEGLVTTAPLDTIGLTLNAKTATAEYGNTLKDLDFDAPSVALIRNRRGLEEHFPSSIFDTDEYTDDYFKHYSILAMATTDDDYTVRAEMNYIAVDSSTQTLWMDARTSSYAVPENANYPAYKITWTLLQVKKSDVASVESIDFWKAPYPLVGNDVNYFSVYEDYRSTGSFPEKNDGCLIARIGDIAPAINRLYVDDQGNPIERDDHVFLVESRQAFKSESVIALRLFQGSSDSSVTVNRVWRSAEDELTVEVERNVPNNPSPDMNWRFVFLAIPNYDTAFKIKVNTTTAGYKEDANGFQYIIRTNEATGEKYAEIGGYVGTKDNITIPDSIDGCPVTAVSSEAFKDNTTIRKVTFPYNNHIDVGGYAFSGCTSLENVNMLYGVFSLGEGVFYNCTALRTFAMSNNLSAIPAYTFYNCKKLKSIGIPAPITFIGQGAFQNCASLNNVRMGGANIERIMDSAFLNCPELKSIIMQNKNTALGANALGYHNGAKVDGFKIYGYTGSTAETYASDNGFNFKSIDNAGPIDYNTEEIWTLPEECGTFSENVEAIYCTSADELSAAIETLYDGRRENDKYIHKDESFDAAWYDTHDVIAIRVPMASSADHLYVPYMEIDYDDDLMIEVIRLIVNDWRDEEMSWRIALVSIDKLGYVPNMHLLVYDEAEMTPEKPIIYLYPEEETELTVTVGKPEDLTCTYPDYGDGWHVTAKPDGTLIDDSGRSYYALYWEGKTAAKCDTSDGFVVKGEDTAAFLEEKLAALGLTEREAQEFIVYWLPQLQNNEYNFIRFATMEEIEEIMPLYFSVQPDTLIRVLMQYKPLDEPIEVAPQTLTAPGRKGFTAVEWGGCLIK